MRQKVYWVIADTHLGHNVMVDKGFRKEGFEDRILRNISGYVWPGDVLIHLGDVAFYQHEYWHQRILTALPGECKAWLIRGNHDKKSLSWYLDQGWSAVVDTMTMAVYGKEVVFSHRPLLQEDIELNIHGHLHNLSHRPNVMQPFHCLVQIEETMAPVNLRHLVDTHKQTSGDKE